MLPALIAATIPSPSQGVWHLGPFPLRGYALCIILGIVVAIWIGEKRWQARGGTLGEVQDVAIWAVPFGLVGARLYHVATDWEKYFGSGGDPVKALYVWEGGLGIWGGVALGAVGAWIGARRRGIKILPLLDALAPGVLVAQAIGRWGNWFNQELYGRPTDLPWGLEIQQKHWQCLVDGEQTSGAACGTALGGPYADGVVFHPTFLYECLWNLAAFAVILWLERRFRLGYGRVMAVYVMAYTLGRGWIEYLRVDNVQLENVLGLRFNVWTSIVLFVAAAAYFVWSSRNRPGREEQVYVDGRGPAADQSDRPDQSDRDESAEAADEPAEPAAEPADGDSSTI
ncbi:prolipoprotein diacylglyceryl transferase [Nocardioides nitrophenolicus]|uniref:prolipoprotein diacylglyceryl transferase n=1 Tax=Nocardioides nitrophenolicus TaxID=60489 RepID=UPI0019571E60|nr:prolipoprotein diacylglyceryl transferase [Nocardioides nitrophenolicus]MBM7515282.1 prolipoprotein diacylglyceryl transferase [Nocardioides nitrophenolicus]